MDSEEKATVLPDPDDMVREIRRKPPEDARRMLSIWLGRQYAIGHVAGLREGLDRSATPAKRLQLSEILESSGLEPCCSGRWTPWRAGPRGVYEIRMCNTCGAVQSRRR